MNSNASAVSRRIETDTPCDSSNRSLSLCSQSQLAPEEVWCPASVMSCHGGRTRDSDSETESSHKQLHWAFRVGRLQINCIIQSHCFSLFMLYGSMSVDWQISRTIEQSNSRTTEQSNNGTTEQSNGRTAEYWSRFFPYRQPHLCQQSLIRTVSPSPSPSLSQFISSILAPDRLSIAVWIIQPISLSTEFAPKIFNPIAIYPPPHTLGIDGVRRSSSKIGLKEFNSRKLKSPARISDV